jgi:hypothetical protein
VQDTPAAVLWRGLFAEEVLPGLFGKVVFEKGIAMKKKYRHDIFYYLLFS